MRPAAGAWILLCAWLQACGTASVADGGLAPGSGDASVANADGTPMRLACTRMLGNALGDGYGRLDGLLTAIVQPGTSACPSDRNHLHLQVQADGAIYDVAITTTDLNGGTVDYLDTAMPLPSGPWAEGWHSGVTLDYPQLGIHAGDFAPTPHAMLIPALTAALAEANHVAVFSTAYTDHTGAHMVHRNGNGHDGAVVLDPTSPSARMLLFHFSTQSF